MIEAEALLAALQRAAEGLTLKQLTAQLPESGARKPKLRPALRDLVAAGTAVFDGQRYHAAANGERKFAAAEPAAATGDAAAAAGEAASVEGVPAEAAPAIVAPAIAAKHQPSERAPLVPHSHKPKPGHSPAKAAAHAPHGHGHRGGAKTRAGNVPAALAEGIRLRKDAQSKESAPDPRGAANWGNAREKKAAPAPRQKSGELVGLLHLKAEGYGFVSPLLGASSRDEDVFVPPGQSGSAIDGDIVKLRLAPGRDGRTIGEVIQIVEERRQLAIGAYHERGKDAFVEPHDRRMAGPILVPRSSDYAEGELVKVQIKRGGHERSGQMRGEVLGALGARGEARFEILAAAYAQGFSDEFDATVRTAAEALPDHVRPEDHAGRRDLRSMPLATIDGEDARDFDDAVFVERAGEGYRLVVAIADVASYVHEEGPIDREALRRATSVYFPGTVLPMLPEELSNGICSLNPDVERLCMVCDLQLDGTGAPTSAEVYPAVMKSHARLTYEKVAAVLDGEMPTDPRVTARIDDLKLAGELAKKMTALRIARGALDFDLPEAKIILDDRGEVSEITSRPRNDAHRLVEEFMLAANEGVARFFSQQNLPTLYRVHDQPDADKLEAFGMLASAHGFRLPDRLTPRALGDLLKQLEGAKAQRALTQLLLRAMMQAHYSPDDIGHYGLAAPTYLHFTSPIRRYPDLTVHRLLWKFWARDGKPLSEQERDEEDAQLAGVGAQCSERERAAMRAERDVVSFYSAQFMEKHVGEEFPATITGVADLGLFCQIDSPAVEGLVPSEALGDNIRLDTELQRLTAGKSGKTWSLGDSVQIRVVSADPARRRINFSIVGVEREEGQEDGESAPRTEKKARAFLKSENRGQPKQGGGAAPAYSRGGTMRRGQALKAEPRGFSQDRGFGKELARTGPKPKTHEKPGKKDAPAHGKRAVFAKSTGQGYAGKSFSGGASEQRGQKTFSRSQADERGAHKGERTPSREHTKDVPAPNKRWGQAPAKSESTGWLRQGDIEALAGSKPSPRGPIAAPPRGRTSSRGGPPPRRGQKPNRRR